MAIPTYILASREGLYRVSRAGWTKLAPGRFFGVTVQNGAIYAFENTGAGEPTHGRPTGRIVRFAPQGDGLGLPQALVEGLDSNAHQIDFHDGNLLVVDTGFQRVLAFDAAMGDAVVHQLVPEVPTRSADDPYVNSILGRPDRIYALFHNLPRAMPSEIVEYDRGWRERRRIALLETACHDIVALEDGRLLYSVSREGSIALTDGPTIRIDNNFTRGLAVGPDEIAVGSSRFGERMGRDFLPGYVAFLDRQFRVTARIYVPAAATQIRRLDGPDLSLSQPR